MAANRFHIFLNRQNLLLKNKINSPFNSQGPKVKSSQKQCLSLLIVSCLIANLFTFTFSFLTVKVTCLKNAKLVGSKLSLYDISNNYIFTHHDNQLINNITSNYNLILKVKGPRKSSDVICQDKDLFDARVQWPECADIINHIRDQGKCGCCWAVAVAAACTSGFVF